MTERASVTIGESERGVSVEPLADREQLVTLDGREAPFEVVLLAENRAPLVAVDGRIFELIPLGDGRYYEPRTRRTLRVERTSVGATARDARSGSGAAELRAPMPGRIVRVLVSEGDVVAAGAALIVIEAMKMENELGAPRAGTIQKLAVREGDAVDGGALLVEIS
jgi:glutaconyl-CoA/methylmalonyl-CoA decarboxylase subunit gamma